MTGALLRPDGGRRVYRGAAHIHLYKTAEYALNKNGTGTYVRLASDSSVILDRDRYTFYYQAEGGNYIGITDLSEIGKGEAMVDKDVYVIRGGSYCAIERDGETGKVNTYDRRYGYVRMRTASCCASTIPTPTLTSSISSSVRKWAP